MIERLSCRSALLRVCILRTALIMARLPALSLKNDRNLFATFRPLGFFRQKKKKD